MSEPDPERERKLAELPLYDRLLHGIGRVAQAHVHLDVTLRNLYFELTLVITGKYPAGSGRRNIGPLIRECRDLVASSQLPDFVKAAGQDALNDAEATGDVRDRVIHDWWILRPDHPDGMPYERLHVAQGFGSKAVPSDLGYLDDAEASLRRAQIQITSLYVLVPNLMSLPPGAAELTTPRLLGDDLAMIRGEFDVLPGGDIQIRRAP